MPSARTATFLVVGDMHRHWRPAERAFLEGGTQDLVLFVGDLGDEDTDLVRAIAAVQAKKAVVLGNHDAWQSFSRRKPTRRLLESLAALENDHLGYRLREIPEAGVSLIGARPFSWGGPSLRSSEVYERLYGVTDIVGSAGKIFDLARQAQHRDLVIVGHNGPTGLSRDPHDIWGKDFGEPGGDWGDPDRELALEQIERSGWRVPCVIAGHMHHRLLTTRERERTRFVHAGNTLFVNAAVVPRLREVDGEAITHYLRLVFCQGELQKVDEIWVDSEGEIRRVDEPEIVELQR